MWVTYFKTITKLHWVSISEKPFWKTKQKKQKQFLHKIRAVLWQILSIMCWGNNARPKIYLCCHCHLHCQELMIPHIVIPFRWRETVGRVCTLVQLTNLCRVLEENYSHPDVWGINLNNNLLCGNPAEGGLEQTWTSSSAPGLQLQQWASTEKAWW